MDLSYKGSSDEQAPSKKGALISLYDDEDIDDVERGGRNKWKPDGRKME